jgi:hypothetical protein
MVEQRALLRTVSKDDFHPTCLNPLWKIENMHHHLRTWTRPYSVTALVWLMDANFFSLSLGEHPLSFLVTSADEEQARERERKDDTS